MLDAIKTEYLFVMVKTCRWDMRPSGDFISSHVKTECGFDFMASDIWLLDIESGNRSCVKCGKPIDLVFWPRL